MNTNTTNLPFKILVKIKDQFYLLDNIRSEGAGTTVEIKGQIRRYTNEHDALRNLEPGSALVFIFSDSPVSRIPSAVDGLIASRMCSELVEVYGLMKGYHKTFTHLPGLSKAEAKRITGIAYHCYLEFEKHPELLSIIREQEMLFQELFDDNLEISFEFKEDKVSAIYHELIQTKDRLLESIKSETGVCLRHLDHPFIKKELASINELYALGITCNDMWEEFREHNVVSCGYEAYTKFAMNLLKINRRTHPLCNNLLWIYNDYSNLKSYLDKIRANGLKLNSRLYNYSTVTGRAHDYPLNIQGLPKALRSAIRLDANEVLLNADVIGCEPSLLAGFAGGEMKDILLNGDVYTIIGRRLLETLGLDGIETRVLGKAVVPIFLNGGGKFSFQRVLGITLNTANDIETFLNQSFVNTMTRLDELVDQSTDHGYIKWERGGLKICQKIPDYPRHFKMGKLAKTNKSVLVQGTGSLLLKRIVMELPALLGRYDMTWMLSVHDSLLLRVPRTAAREASIAVKGLMDNIIYEFLEFRSPFVGAKVEEDWAVPRAIGP